MKDGKPHHYIRFEDLDMAMRQFGIDPHPLEIKEAENSLKLEGKRNIDLESFMKIMAKKLIHEQSTKDLERAFRLIDTSNDESIEVEEFRDLLKKVGANFTDLEIQQMVDAADEDGSGKIEEKEFIAVMSATYNPLEKDDSKESLDDKTGKKDSAR